MLRTQAISYEGKSLATFEGQSRLLLLRHDSCGLQWAYILNYFAKARAQVFKQL